MKGVKSNDRAVIQPEAQRDGDGVDGDGVDQALACTVPKHSSAVPHLQEP